MELNCASDLTPRLTGKLTFDFRIIALRCIHHQAKTALDMEIAVYRKLVECEEDRLGITASEGDVDRW